MSERERLLRAIEADPDDDAVRLVYADWCEENGDEARARFIRLQCGRAAGVKEAETLLQKHRTAWTAGLPKWAREVDFNRGFPNVWWMTGKQFLEGAAAVRAVTPLDSLALRLLKGREAEVFASPHLAGVGKLLAGGAQVTDAGIATLAANRHPGLLRWLFLERGDSGESKDHNRLTDAAAIALADAKHLPALHNLILADHKKITSAGLRALTESSARQGLTDLDVSGCSGGPEIAELFHSPGFRLTNLSVLRLSGCNLGDAGVAALAAAPVLYRLRTLAIGENRIGDRGAAALAESPHLAGLTELYLWKNALTDAGVRAIADSPHLKGLQKLELGENPRVTDAGVRVLRANGRHWFKIGLAGTGATQQG